MPFDAVSGLRQALRMKEHEMGLISRKELSEDIQDSINEVLSGVARGDRVAVTFFSEETLDAGEMEEIEGEVRDIDTMSGLLTIITDDNDMDIHGFIEEHEIKISDIAAIRLVDDNMA